MARLLVAYVATAAVFLAIDFLWLTRIARSLYYDRLGGLLLDQPRLGVAAAFYALFVVGIIYFAVSPALREDSLSTALLSGSLFGFFAYATYDLTNYATLRSWPLVVTIVDVAWGTVLSAVSAAAGYIVARTLVPG